MLLIYPLALMGALAVMLIFSIWTSRVGMAGRTIGTFILSVLSAIALGFMFYIGEQVVRENLPAPNAILPSTTWFIIGSGAAYSAIIAGGNRRTLSAPFVGLALISVLNSKLFDIWPILHSGFLACALVCIIAVRNRLLTFDHLRSHLPQRDSISNADGQPLANLALPANLLQTPLCDIPHLVPIPGAEAALLGKTFENEELYYGPAYEWLGTTWVTRVGAVEQVIYKVGFETQVASRSESGHLVDQLRSFVEEALKCNPSRMNSRLAWDAADGNVVLQSWHLGGEHRVAVFVTSNVCRYFKRL